MKKVMLLVLCFVLSGCAGLADYTISLDNGFRIDRLSAHQILIYGDEPMHSDNESFENHLYVPAKVTDVWSDEAYIVAKQIVLNDGEPPDKPTDEAFYYWVIDISRQTVLGPLDEQVLENEVEKLGIANKVVLTPIEELK